VKISSFTTSPGVVASEIGDLPVWVTKARVIVHYLVRYLRYCTVLAICY
jgi:17beta-estradiol 17-dehydrogenase/3beta-hydroxysteroid 3-dehydrogenase